MRNKELQLCSYEQAVKLKAAGFDWYDKDYYYWTYLYPPKEKEPHFSKNYYPNSSREYIKIPTIALALKWFRSIGFLNSVNLYNAILLRYEGVFQVPRMIDVGEEKYVTMRTYRVIEEKTHELAESALLDELLTLIKEDD